MNQFYVSKSQFKARALEFLRQVEASGETLIITDHGKPTLEICPFRGTNSNPFDLLKGSVFSYEDPTEPVDENDWAAGT